MKTDRTLSRLFEELVDSQPLPSPSWNQAATKTETEAAPWPEDIGLPALPQAAGLAAGLLLAGSLAASHAGGWINPLDLAAARFFSQKSVKTELLDALRRLSAPIGSHETNGGVHTPGTDTSPSPQNEGIEPA